MKKLNLIMLTVPVLILILSAGNNYGQKYNPGPQDMTFFSSVDETNQPFAIYITDHFDDSLEYPLVIFLHGAFSNHRLGLRRVFGEGNIQGPDFGTPGFVPPQTDLEVTRTYPDLRHVDYIVAATYARGTAGYQGIPEQDVYEMLADIKGRFSIDEDRIYFDNNWELPASEKEKLNASGAVTLK